MLQTQQHVVAGAPPAQAAALEACEWAVPAPAAACRPRVPCGWEGAGAQQAHKGAEPAAAGLPSLALSRTACPDLPAHCLPRPSSTLPAPAFLLTDLGMLHEMAAAGGGVPSLQPATSGQPLQAPVALTAAVCSRCACADGGLADPASDSRWTTLAQFIPAYQNGVAGQLGGSGLAGSGLGGSGLFGSMYAQQEQQLQQGLLPYAAPQLPGMQAPAQQQLLAQQAQQAALQQHALAGQPLAQQAPAPSHASLPDGALAMGAGTGGPTGGIIEVSTVSGVSTLGQPPPQAQQGASGGPPHGGAQAAAAQPRRSFDSFAQPAGTTAAGPPQQQSATSSGGAPRAAQYLQRASASAHYVSPFLPGNGLGGAGVGGGGMAPPILQLPTGLGDERAGGGSAAGLPVLLGHRSALLCRLPGRARLLCAIGRAHQHSCAPEVWHPSPALPASP